jgi:hypothetical protein
VITIRDVANLRSKLSQCIHRTPYAHAHAYAQPPHLRPKPLPALEIVSHALNPLFEIKQLHTLTSSSLAAPAPHVLQQPVPLAQPVQRIVALAHRAHEAAQCVDLVLARVAAVLVHFADGDLHRGVVLGFDDAVGGAAFAGDVAVLGVQLASWRG